MASPDETPTAPDLAEIRGAVLASGARGRYLPVERLGEGAMGVVVRAYDLKLQREVALKRLQLHASDAEARRRFVREARSLARVSHPAVVEVFDVTEEDEELTIAMELVPGITFDRWLAQDHGWEEALQILSMVARGIAAAHEQGVLHRDIKPPNVIVAEDGRARILDFGLASLAHAEPTVPTGVDSVPSEVAVQGSLTLAGFVMGTPTYMAPEQHRGDPLVPATDQYAFCVMAWEALTGALPFAGETVRILAERKHEGPPAWPERSPVPAAVRAAILRGLEVEPEDRWPTMHALVAALRPARRARWIPMLVLGAMGTAGTAVALGAQADERCTGAAVAIAKAWDDARRDEVSRAMLATGLDFAAEAAERTLPRLDAFAQRWVTLHGEVCEATALRGEQSLQAMDLRMACLGRARTVLGATADVLANADPEIVVRADSLLDDLPDLDRCSDLDGLRSGIAPPPAELESRVEGIRELIAGARARRLAGKYRQAVREAQQAAQAAAAVPYPPLQAEAWLELGASAYKNFEFREAEAPLRRALRGALTTGNRHDAALAASLLVGLVGDGLDRYAEAHAFARSAEGMVERLDDPVARVRLASAMALLLISESSPARAEAVLREAFARSEAAMAERPRDFFEARGNLTSSLISQRKLDEALVVQRKLLAEKREVLGEHHPAVATAHADLARVHMFLGQEDERLTELEAAWRISRGVLGDDHPAVAQHHAEWAELHHGRGSDEAVQAARDAVETFRGWNGEDHVRTVRMRLFVAQNLRDAGRLEEAEAELLRAGQSMERTYPPGHMGAVALLMLLGDVQIRLKRWPAAVKSRTEALAILDAHAHPVAPEAAMQLAAVLHEMGDDAAALPFAERAWRARQDSPGVIWIHPAFVLAQVLWELDRPGDRARAESLAVRSLEGHRAAGGRDDDENGVDVVAWLRARRIRLPPRRAM